MASAAWSAKVLQEPDLGSVNGRTSRRQTIRTPIGAPSPMRDSQNRPEARRTLGFRKAEFWVIEDVDDLHRAALQQHAAQ